MKNDALYYENEIRKAKKISDIFEVVKTIVKEFLKSDQAGLLVT